MRLTEITFADLSPCDRATNPSEDRWLESLATEVDAATRTLGVGSAHARSEPDPILERQLDGSWRAGRYIGELRRDGVVLKIRPRLGHAVIGSWVSAVLGIRVVPLSGGRDGSAAMLAELAAAIWKAELVRASRHGLPGLRAPRAHVGATVHGRLDVSRTVALRATGAPVVASKDRPKLLDNPVARCVVRADEALGRIVGRSDWRGPRVEDTVAAFRLAVGRHPRLPSRQDLRAVRYTPITLPYKRLADLSWRIAKGYGPWSGATNETVDGFLLDVAELWELFLVHCARRAFGSDHVTHGTADTTAKHLLESLHPPGRRMGRLYPDILIGAPGAPRAVIDAKYKRITGARRVEREDLYQLTSYLSAYDPPPALGALGYVRVSDRTESAAFEEVAGAWALPSGQRLRFLRLPMDEGACVDELRRLLPDEAATT